MKELKIGTRGSQLALWQANFVKNKLEAITEIPVNLTIIKTHGDKITNLSFDKMEGKGFFTKELEEALLRRTVDIAVHSLKDLQTTMPDGLILSAVGFREDSREAVIINKDSYAPDNSLKVKTGGIIGSSSMRRKSQIVNLQPDLIGKDLRGNIPTRINKLRSGMYDAIIIAYAGIKRLELDLSGLEVLLLDKERFLPAPGQGVLGIQTRADDMEINNIVSKLDDEIVRIQVKLERGLLACFEGGCRLPLGTYSEINGRTMRLNSILGMEKDGIWSELTKAEISGTDPDEIIDKSYKKLTG